MSKWWDGYSNEDVVVLDDFDPNHGKYLGYYLKIWADHYVFNAEVKGGMLRIRPKVLIVTSQYRLEACFEEPETVSAISRRFQTKEIGSGVQGQSPLVAVATDMSPDYEYICSFQKIDK